MPKEAQIPLLPRARTVALACRQLSEPDLSALNPLLVAAQDLQRFVLGARNGGVFPAAGPPAVFVLDEEVGGADFVARGIRGDGLGWVGEGRGVVRGHVGFDLLWVGAGGGLPAGFFGGGVEVVGEVFGVGVPDFPGGGEAGF